MMKENSGLQLKVIAAFKGFVLSCRLEPIWIDGDSLKPDFRRSMRHFIKGDEHLDLYYKIRSRDIILELIEKIFPFQTDVNLVTRYLLDLTTEWIDRNETQGSQEQLEQLGHEFFARVEQDIRPWLLFLPVEGLEVDSQNSLNIGRCELFCNHDDSRFRQILQRDDERYPRKIRGDDWTENVKSYFTVHLEGHPDRAIQRAIEEANLALSVIRLYISSYYLHSFDLNQYVYRMELSGSLQQNEQSRVFYTDPTQPFEAQFPGSQESRIVVQNFKIDDRQMGLIKKKGLDSINKMLRSLNSGRKGNAIARRVFLAITWFAKATQARSVAESFLMNAIATESLLSKGRTSQKTYAAQMAALVTCNSAGVICPEGGILSPDFKRSLIEASNHEMRPHLIKDRIIKLFSYRNQIAHGAIWGDEADIDNLKDFETLVRNSILSFVMHDWESFEQFEVWMNENSVQF
jgi:hypothetical protein